MEKHNKKASKSIQSQKKNSSTVNNMKVEEHKNSNNHEKKERDNSYNAYNSWANMFNSSLSEDMKTYMDNFMKGTNTSLCGIGTASNHSTNIKKDMLTKLSQNVRNNFEQNMNLGSEILKCKTATDFVEFGRKSFEVNYKNMMKLYSDVMYDMQNMMNQNLKDVKNYTNKSAKDLEQHTGIYS